MARWIGTAEAFRIAEIFKTYEGLRRCGLQYGFAKKAPDGHHYVFDRYRLRSHLRRIAEGRTVRQISEATGVSVKSIHYQIMKLGLTPVIKRGPQFVFDRKDAQLLIDIYQASHHGSLAEAQVS